MMALLHQLCFGSGISPDRGCFVSLLTEEDSRGREGAGAFCCLSVSSVSHKDLTDVKQPLSFEMTHIETVHHLSRCPLIQVAPLQLNNCLPLKT